MNKDKLISDAMLLAAIVFGLWRIGIVLTVVGLSLVWFFVSRSPGEKHRAAHKP